MARSGAGARPGRRRWRSRAALGFTGDAPRRCRSGSIRPCRQRPARPRAIAPSLALGAARGDARALARGRHRAPAVAVAARHCRRSAAPRRRAGLSRARRISAEDGDAIRRAGHEGSGRRALRRAVRARQPRRGADRRRPVRAAAPVSGQLDRLAVTASDVLIADYKTEPAGARRPRRNPRGLHRATCALPRRACRLYPDHRSAPR